MRPFLAFVCLLSVASGAAVGTAPRVIDANRYHLGVPGQPEWQEFEPGPPHGPQLELRFTAESNVAESTLLVRQRDVKTAWQVALNGRRLGALEMLAQPLVRAFSVPAGLLKAGENQLVISRAPSRVVDDIVVGEFVLDARSRAEVLAQATLEVEVSDAATGRGVPCRLTLVDGEDALVPLAASAASPLAERTGVVYTGDGRARLGVAPGTYVLHAGRGFEYSVATERVTVAAGDTRRLALTIRREVPTPGLVACDTHIHTLTFSKHGDATLDERMLTIAGEGIELAVATDHNHHADYTEAAARTGMNPHFRSVVGNEVTTKAGHFNAFPVKAGAALPDAQLTDWPALLASIRTVTGARVITLNHPRDVHSNFTPLGPENFNAATGDLKSAPEFAVDAIEVVTSAAMQSDIMRLYRDWFALLNRGHRVAAIGSSDTHDVSRFILGQARTYAVSQAADPAAIDVEEICASFRAGKLLVSLGLLAQMSVDDRFTVGDLATGLGGEVRIVVEVTGPSWVNADRVELFANGIKVRAQPVAATRAVRKARVEWTLPRPAHDVHLVAIATGPGVTAPYCETPRPYQASSRIFTPRVIGSTNPIWIDADGDGKFTAARAYAVALVQRAAGDPARLQSLLGGYDQAVQVQAADVAAAGTK
ncbi:MAG: CehA/McbA family metallohydrolase [Opitutaceae bacterium]|nr:CehA/McbA family metallohydrolase [Opitutaceae bacterium]